MGFVLVLVLMTSPVHVLNSCSGNEVLREKIEAAAALLLEQSQPQSSAQVLGVEGQSWQGWLILNERISMIQRPGQDTLTLIL